MRPSPRRLVLIVGVLAALVAALAGVAVSLAGPGGAKRVAVVPAGRTALELVGVVQQIDDAFVGGGYVTHIAGVPDAALFTDPAARDARHARVTFHVRGTTTGRSAVQNIVVRSLAGPTSFYLQATPGADFANPATFAEGQRIAAFSTRIQSVINVLAQDRGVATASEELTQTAAGTFSLRGKRYRLGAIGSRMHLEATGHAMRTSVEPHRPTISQSVFAAVVTATE